MRRLLLLFFAVVFVFLAYRPVYAKSTGLQLVTIPYETREDLDVLFAGTSRPLQYLDGEEVEKPTFMALVSKQQNQKLTGQGYQVTVIDTDADLDRYTLLWHKERDQSSLLSGEGEIFVISPYYTLLKSPAGQPFTHEGASAPFFDLPFMETIATPILREKTLEIIQTPIPKIPEPTKQVTKASVSPLNYRLPVFLALILLGLTAGLVLYAKKRKSEEQQFG